MEESSPNLTDLHISLDMGKDSVSLYLCALTPVGLPPDYEIELWSPYQMRHILASIW